ncbi:MAG: hypothetical protein IT559_02460 [Alphaproteobacteria bacterium]|nr:hypothetical protein [Alphaproteobacteria bacterium]
MPALAYADCAAVVPLGSCTQSGLIDYDTGLNTLKWCNGANYYNMSSGSTASTCSQAGLLEYDGGLSNYKFCNGTNWIPLANGGTHGLSAQTKAIDYRDGIMTWSNGTNWIAMVQVPAPTHKCVFVSSALYTGAQIGGVSGAHAKCTALAAASGRYGTYKAWIADSTAGSAPSTSFSIAGTTLPFKLPNGTTVADNWADLIDGSLDNAIERDENGNVAGLPERTWTNVNTSGARLSSSEHCSNWGSTSGNGSVGRDNEIDSDWTYKEDRVCSDSYHIYCFEQ